MIIPQLDEGYTVTLNVKGRSMMPFIKNGEKVLLEKVVDFEVGDIVLAHLPEVRYVLHRIISCSNNSVTLMGDGNIFGGEHCPIDSLKAVCRFKYSNDNKMISLTSNVQMARSELWRKCIVQRDSLLSAYAPDKEETFWRELFHTCLTSGNKFTMSIRPTFILKEIDHKMFLLPMDTKLVDFASFISLNESALFLYTKMKGKVFNIDTLVKTLLDEYEVDRSVATKDCISLLEAWFANGIIGIENE